MSKFYGIYAGVCVDNADPQKRNRVRLRVPQILGKSVTNWADACMPVTSTAQHASHTATITTSTESPSAHSHTVDVNLTHTAHKKVPDPGQSVWVMFIGGDPNFPVWVGVGI